LLAWLIVIVLGSFVVAVFFFGRRPGAGRIYLAVATLGIIVVWFFVLPWWGAALALPLAPLAPLAGLVLNNRIYREESRWRLRW
jgi:hypothetical protein